jgi:hypothetical protein
MIRCAALLKFRKKSGGGPQRNAPDAKTLQEVQNTLFRPLQEKFHTVVLDGVRNIPGTLSNPPMKFLL